MFSQDAQNTPAINLEKPAILTSDQHVPPVRLLQFLRDANAWDKGAPLTQTMEHYAWLNDTLLQPSGSTQIWLGDVVHLKPNMVDDKKALAPALTMLTDRIVKHDLNGNDLIWLPGNHDPESKWPAAAFQELHERGIIVPERRLILHDQIHDIEYQLMHGDSEQPALYDLPVFDFQVMAQLCDKVLTTLHRIRFLEQDDGPYPISRLAQLVVNSPQKRWNHRNLGPQKIRITGHTHIRELDLKSQYGNTGFRDLVFNWLSGILVSTDRLALWNLDLNPGAYQAGDILTLPQDKAYPQISYHEDQLALFGAREPQEV